MHKKKINKGAVIALVLSIAVIASSYAFLFDKEKKRNVITVGNVGISLREDEWYDLDGNVINDENDNDIPDFAEKMIPGREVDKEPYIVNESNMPVWVYMSVCIPTITAEEASLDKDGKIKALDDDENFKIDVVAYGIQDLYDDVTGSAATWNAYANDETVFPGTAIVSPTDRIEVFEIKNINTTDWTLLSTYISSDGNNYYLYGHNEILEKDDDTSSLFTSVMFSEEIGDPN